jgi:deoxyribonuclease-4
MPTSGGLWRALDRGAALDCEIVQIFVKNNRQWFGRPLSPDDLAQFVQHRAIRRFDRIFGHTGYLINLGAPASANRDKSINSLIQEIKTATALGLPFLVMHPGAHLGQGEQAGLKQIVAGLDEVIRSVAASPVRIALESTAGQGTTLGHQIAHLAAIYDHAACPQRLGICLDTAHLFAAGYDICAPHGWDAVIAEVDALIGLKEILVVHLNDSKAELGSRLDRHAGIGQGNIGRRAFRHIINDQRFSNLPGCLETPKSPDLHEDRQNLAILRSLRRRHVPIGNRK